MTFEKMNQRRIAIFTFTWKAFWSIVEIPFYIIILAGILGLFLSELFRSGTKAVENIKAIVDALKQKK
jgi:hypothetical protein